MQVVVVAAVVVVLSACGRIGFDGASIDSGSGATDGPSGDVPGSPFMIELPAQSAIADLAVVPTGGVIAVGARIGILTLDGISDPGVGALDLAIIALDPDGHARWLHQYGGTENDFASSVAIAPDGSIYVGGRIENNASLGGPLRLGTDLDAFLAKYTADGDYVWDVRFGGAEPDPDNSDLVLDIAVRDDGEVFVAGRVAGVVDFGAGSTPASTAVTDAFAARFSPAGQLRWARRFGNLETNALTGIAVTNDAVFAGGHYSGTPDFGSGELPERGSNDAVVLRMDAATNEVAWVSTFGGADNQRIHGVALHGDAIVGAGYYWQTIDVPGVPPAQRGDGIVVAYSTADGSFVDAHPYGGTNCDFLVSAHAADGQVIAAGTFEGTIRLDTSVASAGLADSIVFGVDGDGFQWHRAFGDATDEIATSAAGGLGSALYVAGTRNLQFDVGCNTIPGATTGYIRRY